MLSKNEKTEVERVGMLASELMERYPFRLALAEALIVASFIRGNAIAAKSTGAPCVKTVAKNAKKISNGI